MSTGKQFVSPRTVPYSFVKHFSSRSPDQVFKSYLSKQKDSVSKKSHQEYFKTKVKVEVVKSPLILQNNPNELMSFLKPHHLSQSKASLSRNNKQFNQSNKTPKMKDMKSL